MPPIWIHPHFAGMRTLARWRLHWSRDSYGNLLRMQGDDGKVCIKRLDSRMKRSETVVVCLSVEPGFRNDVAHQNVYGCNFQCGYMFPMSVPPFFLHYCSLFPKLLASQSSSSIRIWALWVTCGLSSSFVGYSLVTDGDSLKFVNICKLVTLAFPQVMRNHMAGNFVSVFKGCFFKQVAVCKQ